MAAGNIRQTADEEEEKGLLSTTQAAKIEMTDSKRERAQKKYKLAEKEQVTMRWSNIELEIKVAAKKQSNAAGTDGKPSPENEKRIQILRGISGCAKAGELYCIMGASGGGKTTLLSILTGRIRTVSSLSSNSTISGHVHLNNMAVDCSKDPELNYLLKNIRFVMQHDVLYPTEKCREVITTSAKLRLQNRTAEERDELINFVMDSLDLTKCGDTFIGSEAIRGLSGGERTRTSIGVEVATNPRLIVLDEPTSGLDSASAYATMLLLKKLASLGRTVIACIHQPSSEILEVIDRLMVLAKGKVAYEGAIRDGELADYLSRLDCACPPYANVTDHFISSLNAQPEFFIEEWRKHESARLEKEPLPKLENEASVSEVEGGVKATQMVPFCTQLSVLLARLFWIFFRDSASSTSRMVKMVIQALLLGIIWYKLPYLQELSDQEEILTTINNRMGGIFMSIAFTSMNILSAACIEFPSERLIFEKERSARWYRSVTYLLAKLLILLPWNALVVLSFSLIAYWMVGFNMTFADYFGGLLLLSIACDSFAVFISTFAANARQGSQYMPIITNFLILFSGMFIAIESIPSWLRWLRWLNPYFYGLQFLAVAEFDGVQSADGLEVGELALERVGYGDAIEKYFNLVVLTILWAGLRLCAFVSIMVKYGW